MMNFHLSWSQELRAGLQEASRRALRLAAVLAQHAIEQWKRWLIRRRKRARHQAIASFAAECAGTSLDLDTDLETASLRYFADARD